MREDKEIILENVEIIDSNFCLLKESIVPISMLLGSFEVERVLHSMVKDTDWFLNT